MRAPHPGEYIREDILPATGMTITALAKHLGVSRVALSEVVNERRSVSLDMARRFGQAFGNSTRFWVAIQMEHDLAEASKRAQPKVRPLPKSAQK